MKEYEDEKFYTSGLNEYFQQYHVPYPDEDSIDQTIETLRIYVPAKKRYNRNGNLKELLHDAAICMNFSNALFWIVAAVLYGIGWILTSSTPIDAYKIVLILAPLPFVFSLLEAFRGREEGVLELELACRITPQEIIVSRLLVAGGYTTALNIGLSLVLFYTKSAILFGRITLLWLVPMLIIGSASLCLCSKIKSIYAVPAILSGWMVCAAAITIQEQIFNRLLSLNIWACVVLLLIGIGWLTRELFKLKKQYGVDQEVAIWN